LRAFNPRRRRLATLRVLLALHLHRPLAPLHLRSNLPHHFALSLNAFDLLRLFALLFAHRLRLLTLPANLGVALLPVLIDRRLALLALFSLASLMIRVALLLDFASLPVAILADAIRQRFPVEHRSPRGRVRSIARPIDTRRAIHALAHQRGRTLRASLLLPAIVRTRVAFPDFAFP